MWPFQKKIKAQSDLLILYGTNTGNSKLIAQQAHHYLNEKGFQSDCLNMTRIKPNKLTTYQTALIIVSTHGEGEPPSSAMPFFKALHHHNMPALKTLNYSICSLGDSSYDLFCEAGKQLDNRLIKLGAHPINKRTDCDVEFSEPAMQWIKDITESISSKLQNPDHQP